ncbi:MAG: S41 family peptidase [Gemmatimonadota bacterium]
MTRSILAPAAVLVTAAVTGGWFLQQGVDQEQNVYLQVRLFQEVVDRVADQYVEEVDRGELYERAINGLLDELGDPNTSFIEASEYESFRIRTQGDYGGVGLEIVEQDGWITVVSPIPGTPAARAGIRAGDRFAEVAGESAEGWNVDQVADRLRGEPGTTVDVEILRIGVDEPIPFTLERAEIKLRAVPFATLLEGNVGYVPLQVFQEGAAAEVRAAVDSLRDEGAKSVVLDLRGNPGGLLDEGVGVSDLFLEAQDEIVETRGRAPGQSEFHRASSPDAFRGLPVVVLVDETSASASEIVAGALQDHDRGLLVGNTSFGKGSVQTLFQLSGGNVLRLTTARWYTPVGRSIQMAEDQKRARALGRNGTLTLAGQLTERPDSAERPTFRSDAGRVLYGGGGITPDVVVLPDTLSSDEQLAVRTLFREAGALNLALFNFATRYVQEHPGLERDFRVTDADLDTFAASMAERGIDVDRDVLGDAERFLRFQLRREIGLQAWGDEGEFQQVLDDDLQLQRALDLLRGSSSQRDLFRMAVGETGSAGTGDASVGAAGESGGAAGR